MKNVIFGCILAITLTGCGKVDTVVNKYESTFGMLHRTVTIYSANGTPIKSWNTDNQIDYGGGFAQFIDKDGVNVRVSGTVIVEGK